MLENHLVDVRAQKKRTEVPTVRFCVPLSRPSPTKSPRLSRAFGGVGVNAEGKGRGKEEEEDKELAMERVREMRRGIVFRPRFDPEGVRRLCSEALAELEG